MAHPPTAPELAFVAARRVGRLATADAHGRPSAVPVCYALSELDGVPTVVTALDEKPKSVPATQLKRVRNLLAQPRVSIVVDDYTEDWARLAYVQLAGSARLMAPGEPGFTGAVALLRAKYPQYAAMAIEANPLIAIAIDGATSWGVVEGAAARPSDLHGLIAGRRSVRTMLPTPVPRAEIERAIAAAGWAPSPHGRQPWRFAVLEAPERKERLVEAMAAEWRRQLRLDGQDETIVQIRLDKSRARIMEAPTVVVPCLYLADLDEYPDPERAAAERTMAVQSLGAAVENFLLSVYAAGLDAGWMCAPLFCPDVVREALGLDAALIPQALLPVGYAAKEPVRRPRLPLDRLIVDWS